MSSQLDNDTALQALTAKHQRILRGRPAYYAVLPFATKGTIDIIKQFYHAITKLQYRETIGLARTIGVSYATVNRWRYRETMPRNLETILAIIEWHKAGKPLIIKKQEKSVLF